jgi:hypothetical protein
MIHSGEELQTIEGKEDLVTFVRALASSLAQAPQEWENTDLRSYLDALAAWIDDMEGYYCQAGEPLPEQPTWSTIAEMLKAASVYE